MIIYVNLLGQSKVADLVCGPSILTQHWDLAVMIGRILGDENVGIKMKSIQNIWGDAEKEDFPGREEIILIMLQIL